METPSLTTQATNLAVAQPNSSNSFSIPFVEPSVRFDQVTLLIDGVKILDSVEAQVPQGSCTAIIGPNGAGKTTLLLCLLGQLAYSGKIHLSGQNPVLRYVPQKLEFDRGMPITVADLLALELQQKAIWLGVSRRIRQKTLDALAMVKAESIFSHKLGTLSGGELQRVLLALALLHKPDILILDEPAANIDIKGELLLCEILEKLRKELNFTQIMVSHDLPLVMSHATHVICLNHKVMGEGCPKKALQSGVLLATFGIHAELQNFFGFQQDARLPCNMQCAQNGHPHYPQSNFSERR